MASMASPSMDPRVLPAPLQSPELRSFRSIAHEMAVKMKNLRDSPCSSPMLPGRSPERHVSSRTSQADEDVGEVDESTREAYEGTSEADEKALAAALAQAAETGQNSVSTQKSKASSAKTPIASKRGSRARKATNARLALSAETQSSTGRRRKSKGKSGSSNRKHKSHGTPRGKQRTTPEGVQPEKQLGLDCLQPADDRPREQPMAEDDQQQEKPATVPDVSREAAVAIGAEATVAALEAVSESNAGPAPGPPASENEPESGGLGTGFAFDSDTASSAAGSGSGAGSGSEPAPEPEPELNRAPRRLSGSRKRASGPNLASELAKQPGVQDCTVTQQGLLTVSPAAEAVPTAEPLSPVEARMLQHIAKRRSARHSRRRSSTVSVCVRVVETHAPCDPW